MDQNTVIILLGALVVLIVFGLIFGRRLGHFSLELLGFKATADETNRKGARISNVKNKGDRIEASATGPDATIERINNEGNDAKFIAKS